MGISCFFCIEQKVTVTGKTFSNSKDKKCNRLDNHSTDNTETTIRIPISLHREFLTNNKLT